MAANATASEAAPGSLKCKTWVLKVSIHCEGCKREVKKAFQKLEGVYKINVDSQQHKVTVTGNVNSEALLNKLSRIGKHAEIVQENYPVKPTPEKAEKQNIQRALSGELANNNVNNAGQRRTTQVATSKPPQAITETSHKTTNPAKNSNPSGGKAVLKTDKESNVVSTGNNKGKGQKGILQKKGNVTAVTSSGSMNHTQGKSKNQGVDEKEVSPKDKQAQITIPDPMVEESVLSQEIVLSYNLAHHSSDRMQDLYHEYIPSQPSVYTEADQLKTEQVQEQLVQEQGQEVRASSMNSFDMFSEENANGCSIM